LNTYRAIIEEKYGMKVVGLCLVCLHPDNCNKDYQIIKVPFIDKEIVDLFEYRKEMLVSNEIKSVEKKKIQAGVTAQKAVTRGATRGCSAKKYAKVDAETQTEASNQTITSFFSADAKNEKKKELAAKARPLMINLECL
jgi:nucleoside diphosphate kinase